VRPLTRRFDARVDRVARKSGHYYASSRTAATTDFNEAMTYAAHRARITGVRQTVRAHSLHGWWLVLTSEQRIDRSVLK
jgi:hypothetical protein